MIKYIFFGLSFLCLFNVAAYANPLSQNTTEHKEEMGLGLGALIGGLIAGPPGAIIGAAGGAWYGNKEQNKDTRLVDLEKRLLEKQAEFVYLQNQLGNLQTRHTQELQNVNLENRQSALAALSNGISLTVYFRTGKTDINQDTQADIARVAHFVKDFPEIQLQLEAHADRRGDDKYNQELSQQRAQSVVQKLINAGLVRNRIHSHAYGESQATASEGDVDGYAFDRRVNIHLKLDTEV